VSILVTDTGFGPVPAETPLEIDLDAHPSTVPEAALVSVTVPGFGDGRAFTLARSLRRAGYKGRLRASGPVLPDQYAMARRAGFDEIEIPDDHAARHVEAHWLARADWRAHDYQSRLRG